MIDVAGLKLSLDAGLEENHALAIKEIAHQLGISASSIKQAQLVKRSVDARKKANVHFVATYRLTLPSDVERSLLDRQKKDRKLKGLQINPAKPYAPLSIPRRVAPRVPPVVVGMGPAGLFAAWYLTKCGLEPVLIEQGAPVEQRSKDVDEFFATGKLHPFSNIQFGEGGAGTFSDGKLTTNAKNKYSSHVLQWFVDAGAPESILWQAHPHLGSDNLVNIVASIRNDILRLGGKVHFHTKLTGLSFEDGALREIELRSLAVGGDESAHLFTMPCHKLILACGHSARDVFELALDLGLSMEQKPFSMGVRIEHPQALINEAQWGSAASHPALGAAEYKLAIHLPSGRHVYSFCMCPGGEVVAAASEEGGVVTNGMSRFARDGENANAALLVNVDPSDLASDDVLAGVKLQRDVEQRAFRLAREAGGAPYQAPAQTLESFLGEQNANQASNGEDATAPVRATYERGVVEAPIDQVLPAFVAESLREALPLMARKIRGFDDPAAVITAPETRSSSPVRIRRDESLQAYFASADESIAAATGLYPCGEGPGFAGGIMSAAADGLKVAEAVASTYPVQEEDQAAEDALAPAIAALQAGEPVIFPTDTVFGLGVAVNAASSPELLYDLKGRSDNKPIAWLVGGIEDIDLYGKNVPDQAYDLVREGWPGALTLVVEASDAVPSAYRSEVGTIALRVPDHPIARALIEAVGPLATTSANLSGKAAPAHLDELPEELTKNVLVVVGETFEGQASSVIDCTQTPPRILRRGGFDPASLNDSGVSEA